MASGMISNSERLEKAYGFKIIFLFWSGIAWVYLRNLKEPVCFHLSNKFLGMYCIWYFFPKFFESFHGTHRAPWGWDHVLSFYHPEYWHDDAAYLEDAQYIWLQWICGRHLLFRFYKQSNENCRGNSYLVPVQVLFITIPSIPNLFADDLCWWQMTVLDKCYNLVINAFPSFVCTHSLDFLYLPILLPILWEWTAR